MKKKWAVRAFFIVLFIALLSIILLSAYQLYTSDLEEEAEIGKLQMEVVSLTLQIDEAAQERNILRHKNTGLQHDIELLHQQLSAYGEEECIGPDMVEASPYAGRYLIIGKQEYCGYLLSPRDGVYGPSLVDHIEQLKTKNEELQRQLNRALQ